ncbi:[2Fe-2S]-binding, partial [Trinorchestia longiramus]
MTSPVSPAEVPVDTRLVDYLRYHAALPGTKVMCREGGCGACIVVATAPDLNTNTTRTFSVQACQLLVYACANWDMKTIEGLGSRHDGYHEVQKALAGFYGTQCGYCSPGMVMTMHGEMERKGGQVTAAEVERALDGNICRCTGYRPILDAFKSLSVDGEDKLKQKLADIEVRAALGSEVRGVQNQVPTDRAAVWGETARWVMPRSQWWSFIGLVSHLLSSYSGEYVACGKTPVTEARDLNSPTISDKKGRWFHPTSGD